MFTNVVGNKVKLKTCIYLLLGSKTTFFIFCKKYFFLFLNMIISFKIIVYTLLCTFYGLRKNFYEYIWKHPNFLPQLISLDNTFIESTRNLILVSTVRIIMTWTCKSLQSAYLSFNFFNWCNVSWKWTIFISLYLTFRIRSDLC